MNDLEVAKQLEIAEILARAFKRSIIEHIGAMQDKPRIEQVAWWVALVELRDHFGQLLQE